MKNDRIPKPVIPPVKRRPTVTRKVRFGPKGDRLN